jgi:hypothetical protein
MSISERRRPTQKVIVGRNDDRTLTSLKLIRGRDFDETGNEFPDLYVTGGVEVKKTVCTRQLIVTRGADLFDNSYSIYALTIIYL